MAFQIVRDNITQVRADAIVNTTNSLPFIGSGTDSAIYKAAGTADLLRARRQVGKIVPGEAVATPAFRLNAKYVIHTVGPKWKKGQQEEECKLLAACYHNCLKKALELGCASIAFPLLSAGYHGFPKDQALQIALSVIQPFVLEQDMDVILVVFDRKAFELSGKLYDNVIAYVDEHYVQMQGAMEERRGKAGKAAGNCSLPRMANSVPKACGPQKLQKVEEYAQANDDMQFNVMMAMPCVQESSPEQAKVDIDQMLEQVDLTFQEKLFEIMDGRRVTGPQVYKAANLSKQVFSKIQCDKYYHPNKYTALALCLALKLNLQDTLDLIGRAGWTLSPSSKADLIIKGCILNGEYNVINVNILLFDRGYDTLDKLK